MRKVIVSLLLVSLALAVAPNASANVPTVGPREGAVLLVGGGDKTSIWPMFFDLVGDKNAPIVVITTANATNDETNKDFQELKAFGATRLTLLHTDSRETANSDSFIAPLRNARAVWIAGGRQWRLVDSYLDTKTEREIQALLDRGGIVAGSSAGASIQASYLVRGAKSGNKIVMAPGYERGFGLLKNTAIDQHVNTRSRVEDLGEVLQAHPELLGIGLDESTAIVVKGDTASVVGAGFAHFSSREAGAEKIFEVASGASYDFAARRPVDAISESTGGAGDHTVDDKGAIRVAIYADEGSPKAPDLIEGCLTDLSAKFQIRRVTAEEIRQGALSSFDVLAQGGGRASVQSDALGETGKERIREFVRNGGGYVGICAGAYLAASDRPYYLRLVNARVVDREHWARGGGDVQIRFTEEGRRELQQKSPVVQIRYNQGPLLARDAQTDLPTYTELAVFETEIAKKGAPQGVMKGTSAMVSSSFGKGRVFLSSPHPERTAGLERILQAAVTWSSGRDSSPNP
ncbi:cyanophycinase [Terrimicrobium sacchariphilum]|uniref:Cyanophycinase n=1 Tax=Terrimicrobium sacchariphilum TaxID=690879 RepID=A0A146GFV7_TERSA|nr:Type 1 glutamine amidotransferase-like domain-containing protein [Terrimicrobium sacchariphilum]GAT35338.1 cyanophycinase [Terrimicrobium sacchariphilum]